MLNIAMHITCMAELLNTDQHIHIKFMIVVSTGMKGREYKQEKIKRQLKITYRIFFSWKVKELSQRK